MDEDISHSVKHMNDAEGKLGKWTLPETEDLQLGSDPIVDTSDDSYDPHLSADHSEPKYPINYFVPDFGLDEDVVSTQAHEAAASESLGHVWAPYLNDTIDEGHSWAQWENIPTADAEFKLVMTGETSDPHLQTYDDRGHLTFHYPKEGEDDPEEDAHYDFDPSLDHDITTS